MSSIQIQSQQQWFFFFFSPEACSEVKELLLIGNRVECLLMLDFEITTDNIVHSRSQAKLH